MKKLVRGAVAAVMTLVFSVFLWVVPVTAEDSLEILKLRIRYMSHAAISAATAGCIYNDLVRKKVRRIQDVWLSTLPLYAVYAIKTDGYKPNKWQRRFFCLKSIKEQIKVDGVFDNPIIHLHQNVYIAEFVPTFVKHNLKVASEVLGALLPSYCMAVRGPSFRYTYLLVFPLEVVAQKEKRFNKNEWQISIKKWRWGYQIGCFKTEAERQSALYKAAIKLGIVTPKRKQLPQRKGKGRGG